MKRVLLLVAVAAAAAFVPTPANADHLCIERGGDPVWCAPHVSIKQPEPICVTQNGHDLICVF